MKPAWMMATGAGFAAVAIAGYATAPVFWLGHLVTLAAAAAIAATGFTLWLDDAFDLLNRREPMPDPIEPQHRQSMNDLARILDLHFNGPHLPGVPRKIGFVLLTAEFGRIENGRVNYISNGEREDMIAMLREYLARLEGRAPEAQQTRQ